MTRDRKGTKTRARKRSNAMHGGTHTAHHSPVTTARKRTVAKVLGARKAAGRRRG